MAEASLLFPDKLQLTDTKIYAETPARVELTGLQQGTTRIAKITLSELLFTLDRSPDSADPLVSGTFVADVKGLANGDVTVTATPITGKLTVPNSSDASIRLQANASTITVDTAEAVLALRQCVTQVTVPDTRVSANLQCRIVRPDTSLSAQLDYSLENGKGKVRFETGKASPDSKTPLLRSLLKKWAEPFDIVSGSLSVSGRYDWDEQHESLSADVMVENAGGFYENILFSGMDYTASMELLPAIRSRKPVQLNVAIIDIGIPVTGTQAMLDIQPSPHGNLPLIGVNGLRMNVLESTVTGNGIHYDPNTNDNRFTLNFEGLDLAALVAMQKVEGLQATGLIDGTLPVHLNDAGLEIAHGELHARPPGGRIQYLPEGGTKNMKKSAPGTGIVFQILEDMDYHTLDATANYTPDGNLLLSLAIKGMSPKLDTKRPVHFNLTLEQNVLKLLKSLRIAEDIDSVLDKNVQEYFRKHR
jgi:hypothetical protein